MGVRVLVSSIPIQILYRTANICEDELSLYKNDSNLSNFIFLN